MLPFRGGFWGGSGAQYVGGFALDSGPLYSALSFPAGTMVGDVAIWNSNNIPPVSGGTMWSLAGGATVIFIRKVQQADLNSGITTDAGHSQLSGILVMAVYRGVIGAMNVRGGGENYAGNPTSAGFVKSPGVRALIGFGRKGNAFNGDPLIVQPAIFTQRVAVSGAITMADVLRPGSYADNTPFAAYWRDNGSSVATIFELF